MNPKQVRCHLSQLLHRLAQTYGNSDAFLYHNFGEEEWLSVSRQDVADMADRVSRAMLALGIGVQENVGMFAPNCLQLVLAEFGAWGIRAATVPVFSTDSEYELRLIVEDANIRYLFVGCQEHYDKAFSVLQTSDSLERIVVFDPRVKLKERDKMTMRWDEFVTLGDGKDLSVLHKERLAGVCDDELMSVIYTSGTSGESKGVMLTHAQEQAAMIANDAIMELSCKDRILSYLPFSHILEKGWALFCMTEGCLIMILGDIHRLMEAMTDTNPTCMCSVPRFWEKVYAAIQKEISSMPALKSSLLKKAVRVGCKYNVECLGRGLKPSKLLTWQYKLADKTVLSKLRHKLGIINPNFYPVGGAFFVPKVSSFFHSIGIYMHYGYGMTETFATLSSDICGLPFTIGSAGRPLKEVSVKIADDGEILLKGPTISIGYYDRPDLTAKAYDSEGYLRTGDLGYMKDGELYLTERKKDLYKMSTGKFIAPQQLESKLISDTCIDQVMAVADCRKFVSALIVPAFDELEKYASQWNLDFSDRESVCRDSRVVDFYASRLIPLQNTLAQFEKVKKFKLLPNPFKYENGELTNTLKLKRKVILANYSEEIESMYSEDLTE
jgi:long-chain acyl-CoA synthetase